MIADSRLDGSGIVIAMIGPGAMAKPIPGSACLMLSVLILAVERSEISRRADFGRAAVVPMRFRRVEAVVDYLNQRPKAVSKELLEILIRRQGRFRRNYWR